MGFREDIRSRILVLDGAMGTMLQQGWTEEQTLQAYVDAGADIITTNTFNGGPETLAAVQRARKVADAAPRKVYVAGSMSLTGKSLSLPSDAADPAIRAVDFCALQAYFKEHVQALVEGGADLILIETCFDALNAKAAICAIEELGAPLPVVISATVSDRSGRTLTGQTLEAFYTSIKHCPRLEAFGINCALGAAAMVSLVKEIASFSQHPLIFYPNAGIPDEFGRYNDTPAAMARVIQPLLQKGLVNIVGGCCGTTPSHIKAIAEAVVSSATPVSTLGHVRGRGPLDTSSAGAQETVGGMERSGRFADDITVPQQYRTKVSGLEVVVVDPSRNFTNIGERTNVAGSKKFARLIAENNYAEALQVASAQIEGGADIIDINTDDPMIDSAAAMRTFLRHISGDPAVAKAAIMIDSSHWETILEGLRNAQGKCIVNSISLKEGEQEFLRKAKTIRDYGAAMVVMAFDEEGQAVTYERKIQICERSYRLLTQKAGVPAEDIIFDCNILSIGTGIAEHGRFGVDFIEAVRWIKQNLPGAKTSGGVSNLSFAFRGNNVVREAMHSAFLYHAVKAGLDMAIVNPQMLQIYDNIDPALRKCVEDVIFDTDDGATARLVEKAAQCSAAAPEGTGPAAQKSTQEALEPQERLAQLLVKGSSEGLQECTLECLKQIGSAVGVISGPLMAGMEKVGAMFADGRMFLPQVVKSAKTMRDAVDILQPYMGSSSEQEGRPKFLIATVQGDVHDIGKNITSIVLQCSGFDVTDMGVMVPSEDILAKADEIGADIIGVSGLITPSLQRMEELCRMMAERGMSTPLFVGGAAASAVHTAVRLAPLYPNVCYGSDASDTAVKAKKYMDSSQAFLASEKEAQSKLRELHSSRKNTAAQQSLPEGGFLAGKPFRDIPLQLLPASELLPLLDWRMFFAVCGVKGENASLKAEAMAWIQKENPSVQLCAKFFDCHREEDVIKGDGLALPMLRDGHSLADYFPTEGSAQMGLFAATVVSTTDDSDVVCHAAKVCLAEAASAYMEKQFLAVLPEGAKLIMPGIGYACCPDHSLKRDILSILPVDIALTESCAMIPEASVCGLVIAHGSAAYRDIRHVGAKEKEAYAKLRGFSSEEKNLFLGFL